jgi:TatD DNase family protein
LETLAILAGEGRLHAIGETGFDLYGGTFRETEKIQDELFAVHLETALEKGLPLVLHVRRALHKVFAHTKALKRLPAVVFHAYSGALGDGEALLRRGINAYFSFGAAVTLNHKLAMEACARLPLERLLTETDAPYQPPRGAAYSRWADLPLTLKAIMKLRPAPLEAPLKAVEDLERRIDENWRRVFLNLDG